MTEERLQYYQTMLEAKLNSYLQETGPQQADVAAAMRCLLYTSPSPRDRG